MKMIKEILICLFVLGLAFSGCKKDKDDSPNYLQVGDTIVYLSDGNIKYYGAYSATSYNFDLDFVSKEIVLSTDGSGDPDYTGVGTRVYFETYTSSSTALLSGNYTFLDDDSYAAGTWDYSYYMFDYNGGYNEVYIEEGTITVSNKNDSFVIDFSGKDTEGEIVKLHYSGSLHYYDRSDITK